MELRGYTVNILVLLLVSLTRNDDRIDLGLYANKVVSYGVPTPLVVTMSGYPKSELRLRVSSSRYLVAQWIVGPNTEPPMKPLFQKTDNIAKELRRLHIVPSVNLSYERGYFAELNATFWQSSNIRLTLGGLYSVKSQSGLNPIARTTFLTMNISRDVCIPHAEDEACFHPNTPMEFSVMYGCEIEINLLNNCGMDTNNITWIVMDLAETKKLKTFHHQTLGLTLEPYALRFPNESGPYRNQYVMQISGDSGGRIFVARCYLKALAEAVQAIISGGIVRNVHEEEEIYMDGSPSRDYAKQPDEKQFNVYNWTCRSNDVHNAMCNGRIWTQATFLIPGKSFAVGNKYEFSLSVASDIHPHQISRAHQVLLIVEFKTLQVEVTCVKNCESNAYDPEETVHMAVQCRNCGSYKPKYAWYLDGYAASQTKDLRMRLQTNNEVSKVVLRAITADFRIGTKVHLLTARQSPIYSCRITPTTGTEVITKFNACCWKFNAKVKLFFVYADDVLIHECVYCYRPVYLPNNVTNLMALICERDWKCTKIHMPLVTVHSMGDIPTKSSNDLWTYIKETQARYFNVNDRLRFMAVAQAVANVIREPKTALTLIKAFGEFHPRSLITLSLLAKFTKTLAINLTPINDINLLVMIECLSKLNENFEIVTDTNDARHLLQMPYLNMTIELIKISNFMTAINRDIEPPAKSIFDQYNQAVKDKKLQQPVIDDLLEEISQIDSELVKEHSERWVRSLWQTERLCRFLSSARKHGADSDDTAGGLIDTMTLVVRCMLFKPGLEYAIDTNDARHTVYLSTELLDELKDPLTNKVCIKIISKIRRLNWWYPEERQPSNKLLTVHAYKTGYEFQEELQLHNSYISFRTVNDRFKPALNIPKNQEIDSIFQQLDLDTSRSYGQQIEGKSRSIATASQDESDNDNIIAETGTCGRCLQYGQLNTKMQLLAYRMQLQQGSMVAVLFKNTTHRLKLLLVMKNLPTNLVSAIADSECSVPAHSTNTTMVLRNKCTEPERVYLVIRLFGDDESDGPIPGGPANFSFVFQVRCCDYWKQSKQHWQHINCLPGLQYPRQGYIYCNCSVLGTFSSFVYYVPAIAMPIDITKDILFNWVVLSVYIIALLGTFIVLVLLFRYHNHQPSKTIACDMTDLEEASDRDVHDLLIYLRTGYRDNAMTTATVRTGGGICQPGAGNWRGTGIYDTMTRAQRVCIFLNKLIITYTVCACVWAPGKHEVAYQDTIYFNYRSFLLMVIISLILTNLAQYILESLLLLSH
ncbi:uncharacterized protein Dmoj_GI17585 [Drosophila mojavensis]|uniref:PKD/REJ-like domain-containing protein n=1 Tax=Drosophila mojavensis TaxID=7230 RepID=B4KH44_DROMO|nr:uncharacterized protein Dmoj_GI17585 [Drosophila mojavensis]